MAQDLGLRATFMAKPFGVAHLALFALPPRKDSAVQIGLTEVSGVGNGGHMNFSIWMPGGVRGGDPKASLLHKNTEKIIRAASVAVPVNKT